MQRIRFFVNKAHRTRAKKEEDWVLIKTHSTHKSGQKQNKVSKRSWKNIHIVDGIYQNLMENTQKGKY